MNRVRRLVAATCLLLAVAGPADAEPSPGVVYPSDPELQRAYESGFGDGAVQGEDQGYRTGRTDGYDDGFAAGRSEGEQIGRDEAVREADASDLRDEVEVEAEKTPEPTPTPTPAPTTFAEPEDDGPGVPWWPLSFAVVATVWFVTRRRDRGGGGAD